MTGLPGNLSPLRFHASLLLQGQHEQLTLSPGRIFYNAEIAHRRTDHPGEIAKIEIAVFKLSAMLVDCLDDPPSFGCRPARVIWAQPSVFGGASGAAEAIGHGVYPASSG